MPKTDIVSRLAKVLNQAEHAGTQEESEVFMAKAIQLSTKYGLTLEELRAKSARDHADSSTKPTSETFEVGVKGDRAGGAYARLFARIGLVNDCKNFYNSSEITLYGFSSDIRVTEALYAIVSVQMVEACREYIANGTWRTRGISISNARKSFYDGYIDRIISRLEYAKRLAAAEWSSETGSSSTLVLANKERTVKDFYSSELGRSVKTTRGRLGGTSYVAMRAGDSSAQRANLHERHVAVESGDN